MYSEQTQIQTRSKRSRLIVKKGNENIALPLEDIVLIYTHDKLVFAVDLYSKKYMCDRTLSELENELDDVIFFRANRQYILSINYIRSFKPYEKVKLLVGMVIPEINHSIVVSQETAPVFKQWLRGA